MEDNQDDDTRSISTESSEGYLPGHDINFITGNLRLRMSDPPSWFGIHPLSHEMIHEFRRVGLFEDEIKALNVKFYQRRWFKLIVKGLRMLDSLLGYCMIVGFILYFELSKGSASRYLYISNKF